MDKKIREYKPAKRYDIMVKGVGTYAGKRFCGMVNRLCALIIIC